jgi:hypothetical protein
MTRKAGAAGKAHTPVRPTSGTTCCPTSGTTVPVSCPTSGTTVASHQRDIL